jgi:hypothetical protein
MPALNKTHMLIDPEDGDREVLPGEAITDFRGDPDVFDSISRAPEPGKSGKIITGRGGELYPQVFGLRIVARPVTLRFPGFPPVTCAGPSITALEN